MPLFCPVLVISNKLSNGNYDTALYRTQPYQLIHLHLQDASLYLPKVDLLLLVTVFIILTYNK